MRLGVLGAVLLLVGAAAALGGILPPSAVAMLARRILPVLGFVVAISVVAELAAAAGLFLRLGDRAVALARGRAWILWLLVGVLSIVSTVFLSLDTTAVLLTPVVVAAAQRAGLPTLPFAMTTIWFANCGSLLLPVSNLTNLLAQQRIGTPADFLGLSLAPATVAVLVPAGLLALLHRRSLTRRFTPGPAAPIEDRPLFVVAAVVVLLLLPALLSGVEVWIPATVAAAALMVAFAVRRRRVLTPRLIPVPLVLFAAGLLVVVEAAGRVGLVPVLAAVSGTGADPGSLLRLAAVGAVSANVADNLPVYLALEQVADSPERLMTLLVAVNAGPLVTPWASLATLLWARRLAALGERVRWGRFMLTGALAAVLTVPLATLAIAASS